MERCQRCRKETICLTGSMFDTTMICLECEKKEREHPSYEKAREAELAAVRSGDFNYPGIGRPADL